jgi:hypothetical protein
VRAVLDPNILVAAVLSPSGAPAQLVESWLAGEFELIVSETLLAELERALSYRKIRERVAEAEARAYVAFLREGARLAEDPENATSRSVDQGDDYLLALAEAERAVLVSGDRHVLELGETLPVKTARAFLAEL